MLVKRWGETWGTGGLDGRAPKNGTVERGDVVGGGYSGDRGDTGDGGDSGDRGDTGDGGDVWDGGDTGYGEDREGSEA